MAAEYSRVEILKIATYLLLRLGFQARQRGYRYLREAILIAYQDEDTLVSITKYLYPEIAKRYDTTDKQVERAIRSAVETVWDKGNEVNLKKIFGDLYINKCARPTNTEVVYVLICYIKNDEYSGHGKALE